MKVVGIQIKSSEAIVVVLEKDKDGNIVQNNESTRFGINDANDPVQIQQFRDQVNATLDMINAKKIAILSRDSKGRFASSPISFKLEAIFQLYTKASVDIVSSRSITAFIKKNPPDTKPDNKYQTDAFYLATYLLR